MKESFNATASITINAPASAVWQALVNPDIFKQWMYGSIVRSDWKKGSAITYSGEWEGKKYEDKGIIVEITPNQFLHTTFYSPLSGKKDIPENYQPVTYKIEEVDNVSKLTVTQGNNESQDDADRAKASWASSLEKLKQTIE